ncbi:hypothetical protein ACTMTI_35880 [Nonomuraea sp. H19]|uniref:hypothetical protein n=1 Tax=Nonomuraea sp. H19 TaxID=3452206 RepID=UPI003F8B4A29
MKAITKISTVVTAGAFALVLAGGTAEAATQAMTPAMTSSAVVSMDRTPTIKWLCNKPIVKRYIPQCSNGKRWEPRVAKQARCLQGHGPYLGWTGPAKLTWWVHKCFETSEWEKW